jgi:hypothetical protein
LKSFRVRTAYANTDISISSQGTTTLLRGDETDNNETNQAKNETAALETKGKEIERENKIFPNESYIPEDKMFTVVI